MTVTPTPERFDTHTSAGLASRLFVCLFGFETSVPFIVFQVVAGDCFAFCGTREKIVALLLLLSS